MKKVIYRERAEFTFEHVAFVDGVTHKIENEQLFIREMDDVTKDANGNRVVTEVWAECFGPWAFTSPEAALGVYARN